MSLFSYLFAYNDLSGLSGTKNGIHFILVTFSSVRLSVGCSDSLAYMRKIAGILPAESREESWSEGCLSVLPASGGFNWVEPSTSTRSTQVCGLCELITQSAQEGSFKSKWALTSSFVVCIFFPKSFTRRCWLIKYFINISAILKLVWHVQPHLWLFNPHFYTKSWSVPLVYFEGLDRLLRAVTFW